MTPLTPSLSTLELTKYDSPTSNLVPMAWERGCSTRGSFLITWSDKNLISPYSLINTVPNKYTMGIRDSKTRDCLDVSPLNSYNRHQKKYKIERIYKMKKEEIKKEKNIKRNVL